MPHRRELAKAIAERTMHIKNRRLLSKEIAAYLLTENLTQSLNSLMRDVLNYRAASGLVEALVISAYPISTQVRQDVIKEIKSEYPQAKTITIDEEIDPEVVGGLRIEIAGEQLDLTVRTRLNTLKRLTEARSF